MKNDFFKICHFLLLMVELTPIEFAYLKEKTDILYEHPLACIFKRPVDPEKDNAPDYLDIITHPMDLGTVKTKLANKTYKTSADWYKDVSLVWANAKKYNNVKQSLIWIAADTLQKEAAEYFAHIPKTETDSWSLKIYELSKEIEHLLSIAPHESIVHAPQEILAKI